MLYNHQRGLWTPPWWFHLVPEFFNTAHRGWHPPSEPWSCSVPLCPHCPIYVRTSTNMTLRRMTSLDIPSRVCYTAHPLLSSMALLLSRCYTWQCRWIGVPLLQLLASGVAYSSPQCLIDDSQYILVKLMHKFSCKKRTFLYILSCNLNHFWACSDNKITRHTIILWECGFCFQ